jgi:pimeloyl-[acyl-carrier protein] methyl ester esterase
MKTVFDQAWDAHHGRVETMTLAGEAVRVHRAGQGKPLVCIHGWAMGGRSFARQLDLIADGFEVIAPDLPGFAGSPIPQHAPNIETMSEMVRDLIQTLDLDDVILIGWSMGASIAWHLASTDSARIKALVSIDMSPRVAPAEDWLFALSTGITPETIQAAMLAMRNDWSGYCDLFLDRILAKPDDANRLAMAELAALADPETASQAWSALMHFDARAGLSRIHVPALAIHGGRSVIYPQTVGHEIARLMPQCQAIVLDHVGHAPHIEAPDAFNAHLRTLAKRGPPAPTLCQHITAQ